jgi:hypothetical protein
LGFVVVFNFELGVVVVLFAGAVVVFVAGVVVFAGVVVLCTGAVVFCTGATLAGAVVSAAPSGFTKLGIM